MKFTVQINKTAFEDIQEGIDYYDSKTIGLGKKYHKAVLNTITTIQKNPWFQIRYDNVRCLLVKKFPYMIHFSVIDNCIIIHAVINTYLEINNDFNKSI